MEDRVRQTMANVLGLDADGIGPETTMESVRAWDSLKHMEVVVGLEDEFDFQFGMDEIPEMTGFEVIVRIVAAKAQAG